MYENTSDKEMTVPSSDVKNENSNGDDKIIIIFNQD